MNVMASLEGIGVRQGNGVGFLVADVSVVKSAERVLTILEFFDTVKRSACVSEVARALGFPQSSTSVLLRSLVAMGYLAQDDSRRSYYPTRRVSLLGNWLDPEVVQHGRLLGFANAMAENSGQTVVLAMPNGTHAQYIHVIRCAALAPDVPSVGIGERCSILTTSVGRAMLSTYSDKRISSLVWRLNSERLAGEEPVNTNALIASLSQQRKHGVFLGAGGVPGQEALSVVLDRGNQLMVLGIEGDPDHIRSCGENLAGQLLQSARELR